VAVKPIILTTDEMAEMVALPTLDYVLIPRYIEEIAYVEEMSEKEAGKALKEAYYITVERMANSLLYDLAYINVKWNKQKKRFELKPHPKLNWKDVMEILVDLLYPYVGWDETHWKKEYLYEYPEKKRVTPKALVEYMLSYLKWAYRDGIIIFRLHPLVSWEEAFDRELYNNVMFVFGVK